MTLDYVRVEERRNAVWGSQKGTSGQPGLARCIGLDYIEKGRAKQRSRAGIRPGQRQVEEPQGPRLPGDEARAVAGLCIGQHRPMWQLGR